MDFRLTEDQEQFREGICEFLKGELTSDVFSRYEDLTESSLVSADWVRGFRERLAATGYLSMGWPIEYGGGGRDMVYQLLFHEEYHYHQGPDLGAAYTYLAPSIMLLGSDEQKNFFLPRIARGEIDLFVGYSEPEAGSDLANLQCRAVLDGDEFVVHGQKLFSSRAQHAEYAWMVVRTDPNVPKHKGISLLIVDMKSPGITIGYYKTMSGWLHPTVYFDSVRVPRSSLVSELNRGWYHVMAALDFERASIGNPGQVLRQYDILLKYCKETYQGGHPLINDPRVGSLLAKLAAEVRACRSMAYWVASIHARGEYPQHETSLAALFKRETVRSIQTAHLSLLGAWGQLRPHSPSAPLDGKVEHAYLNDMFYHFAAGGMDITRNVIARRGLGLPRD